LIKGNAEIAGIFISLAFSMLFIGGGGGTGGGIGPPGPPGATGPPGPPGANGKNGNSSANSFVIVSDSINDIEQNQTITGNYTVTSIGSFVGTVNMTGSASAGITVSIRPPTSLVFTGSPLTKTGVIAITGSSPFLGLSRVTLKGTNGTITRFTTFTVNVVRGIVHVVSLNEARGNNTAAPVIVLKTFNIPGNTYNQLIFEGEGFFQFNLLSVIQSFRLFYRIGGVQVCNDLQFRAVGITLAEPFAIKCSTRQLANATLQLVVTATTADPVTAIISNSLRVYGEGYAVGASFFATNTAAVSALSVSNSNFPITTIAGSIIVVSSWGYGNLVPTATVTDNAGNSYAQLVNTDCFTPCTSHISQKIFYAVSSVTFGGLVVTVAWAYNPGVNYQIVVGSYYGYSSASLFGSTVTVAAGIVTDTVTATASAGTQIIIGGTVLGGVMTGFGASQTRDIVSATAGGATEDLEHRTITVTGSYSVTVSFNSGASSVDWLGAILLT
jgi:hypothetical protein